MVVSSNTPDLFTPTKDVRTYNIRSFSASNFYINCSQLNHNKNSFSIKGTDKSFGTVFQKL